MSDGGRTSRLPVTPPPLRSAPPMEGGYGCQAAWAPDVGARPCMIILLMSIRGSKSSSRRMTAEEWRLTNRLMEMSWALRGAGRVLSGFEQSVARVDHNRRFQSRASMRVLMSVGSAREASISARVTWPNRRYSASRGFSAIAVAVLSA